MPCTSAYNHIAISDMRYFMSQDTQALRYSFVLKARWDRDYEAP